MNHRMFCFLFSLTVATSAALPSVVFAHECGESPMKLRAGERKTYRITADVSESGPSHYEIVINEDPTIASVSPDNMDTFAFGEFAVRGLIVGTVRLVFQWNYAPNDASGSCVLDVEVTETPPASTSENLEHSPTSVDPVNLVTGELIFAFDPDLNLGGPMPLVFSRYYASNMVDDARIHSSLGTNWSHNYDSRLIRVGNDAEIITWKGRIVPFKKSGGNWAYDGTLAHPFQLVEGASEFVFADPTVSRIFRFDTTGRLTSIEDGKGNVHGVQYQEGKISQVSDGLSRVLAFAYTSFGLLANVSDGTRTINFGQSYTRELLSASDADGNLTIYTYDATNGVARLTSERRPKNNTPVVHAYDGNGRVISQTDAESGVTMFAYDGLTTTVTDPAGNDRIYEHDSEGRLQSLTDEIGNLLQYDYDTNGNLSLIVDRNGGETKFEYDGNSNRVSRMTMPDNTERSFEYIEQILDGVRLYDLSSVTREDNTTETFEYDGNGNVVRHTDEAGNESTTTYNNHGQPLTLTNPTLGTTTFTYNPDGTRATRSDHAGNTTTFEYDGLHRLIRTTHPDSSVREFGYDVRDNKTSTINEHGGTWQYDYDENGNLETETDPMGNTTTHHYDALDRLVRTVDQDGNETGLDYDERGWLQTYTDRSGSRVTFVRDPVGNLEAIVDDDEHIWMRSYDPEGVLASSSTPADETTDYMPDIMGRYLEIQSPESNTTMFDYDAIGRRTMVSEPAGNTTQTGYDPRGNVSEVDLLGSGVGVAIERNALGRITSLTDPNGGQWQRTWDADGRLTRSVDPLSAETIFDYDARGRLSSVTYPSGLGNVSITYEGLNALDERRYSDGTTLQYDYDLKGHLTSATGISLTRDDEGDLIESNGLVLARNEEGRLAGIAFAPGKDVTYTYDSRQLLVGIEDWNGPALTLTYDSVGRLATITRANGVTTTYAYDGESRVTGITDGAHSSLSLSRDANGRVDQRERTPSPTLALQNGVESQSYDDAHGIESFQYDARGRLIDDGNRTYTWNLASRLTGYNEDGTDVIFTYDAAGQRLSRAVSGSTTHYVWNYGTGVPVVTIIRADMTDQTYVVAGPGGRPFYTIDADSNARSFLHPDENGNVLLLTDDSGDVTTEYAYDPYGRQLAGSDDTNPFTWQGAYGVMREGDSGLYYKRARYYDSGTARFIGRDPLTTRLPRAINPYQYALGDPIRHSDPLGLQATTVEPTPPPTPGSSIEHPVYLSRSEWDAEVRRVKDLLKERVEKAEWGWYDPTVPATFDSAFLKRQREFFEFRGEVMNGGELNYYFQGMYWAELGVPKTVMNGIIHSYKQYKYGRGPSGNDLYAACQGFEDNGNFVTEVRDEFLDRVDDVTSAPRRLKDSVVGNAYRLYYWLNPEALPSSEPAISPR